MIPVRAYPPAIEAAWAQCALPFGGVRNYFADARTRAAYGNFFLPQSWVRTRLALAESLELGGWTPPKNPRILDIGAGLGACGFAAAALLRERGGIEAAHITALDRSTNALAALARFAAENAAALDGVASVRTIAGDLKKRLCAARRDGETYDLAIAGFAFNELWAGETPAARAACLLKTAERLAPNGLLLVLEPALKETALALQETSDLIAETHALVRVAPAAADFPCPLRTRGKYWAHDVRVWNPPDTLRTLNARLWRDVGVLKFHWAAWSNRPVSPPEPPKDTRLRLRLCTPFAELKGRFECAGIAADGRLVRAELPTRGLDKPTVKSLSKIERGDTLFLRDVQTLAEDRVRLPSPEAIARRYSPL